MTDYDSYQSPFSWRYGSPEMRRLWSEVHKRRLWRRVWVALAEAQAELGLVSAQQAADLRAHAEAIDLKRAADIEAEIRHDLMSELRVFAEQCRVGGGILHLGATSMDVEDNADALRLRQALGLLARELRVLLHAMAGLVERWAEMPSIAFTHLQPAEPTTVGYRLAQYAQDLWGDLQEMERVRDGVRGKGFKGAVGTSASYLELLGADGPRRMESAALARLGLEAFPVTTQTYPRKQDWTVLNALAGLAASLYKFALDVRLLQSPVIGEWSEGFAAKQVGSSAMPFKRNPIQAERLNSLARALAQLPRVAWDNAAHSALERTLDDSANRRSILPEAFLAAEELVRTAQSMLDGLSVNERAAARNLQVYGAFAGTEKVMMAAAKAGGDRQQLHEVIREHSLAAWQAMSNDGHNPLAERLSADERITRYVPAADVQRMLDAAAYVGDAPVRARALAADIGRWLRSTDGAGVYPKGDDRPA